MGISLGVVRDERYLEHKTGLIHPEHPNRLKYLYRLLDNEFPASLIDIEAQPVGLEYLELVHTPFYIKKVLNTADRGFTNLAFDTPASAQSYMAAWLAVGGCIRSVEALLAGQCRVAFSLVRPPGHHALNDRAGGFCIFNNLAVTARYAMKKRGLKRILIIDWDVHHGNGLQDVFYSEKEVLYVSSHFTSIYPHTGEWEEAGAGQGEGCNVNLPLSVGMEDDDVLYLYQEVLGPVIRRFRPELIMIAAGFDLHHLDSMSRSNVTENAFRRLIRLVLDVSGDVDNPPLMLALEGGYKLPGLVNSVREVIRELITYEKANGCANEPTERAAAIIEKARRIHSSYGVWAD